MVLMASGYAQATQKPIAVQLHCSVGLGNAIGSLYHAFRMQRAPLVVIAGEAGVNRRRARCPYGAGPGHPGAAGDPVRRAGDSPRQPAAPLLRRCMRSRPHRPSARCLWPSRRTFSISPTTSRCWRRWFRRTRVIPEPALIARAADMLAGAQNPVIIMGDGIAHARAQGELARLAEVLGAGVWGAMASELDVPWTRVALAGPGPGICSARWTPKLQLPTRC